MATIKGGAKLEAHLRALSARLAKKSTLEVGFLSGATYPDGTSVPLVAAIQNFGAPAAGIPPRPFFSNMVAEKSGAWGKAIELNLKATNFDADQALALVGEGIEGQLRQSIIDTNTPPLAPATVKRKGFAKPLVDTSVMLNSIKSRVT